MIWLLGLFVVNDSYAINWFKSWYGTGCQARWQKCGEWVEKNCQEGYGGCNGACILFGIRGDCMPNDLQVSSGANPLEPVYKKDSRVAINRGKSGTPQQLTGSRPTYFDPPQRDAAAIKNGKYQVMEKGKIKEVQLSPSQMQEYGIKPGSTGLDRPKSFNPALYE